LALAGALATTPDLLAGQGGKTSALLPDASTNMSIHPTFQNETEEQAVSVQILQSESSRTRSETRQVEIYPRARLNHSQTIESGEMTGFLAD
jgi:hypothetical protein